MPSTLTHYIFNKDLIKDDKYKNIFLLAGQGADTFFFYGYNLLKRENAKKIRDFGYLIHSIDPSDLYMTMLRYAYTKDNSEREILLNFIRGFMYHYALDRNVHPFVFFNTGFPYTNKIYNESHGKFESILDTLLLKEYKLNNSTRSVLKANKNEIKLCSKMFKYVASNLFNIDYIEDDTYYKAYKDFRFVRLIADSRFGLKKKLFNTFLKHNSINIISQPKKVDDNKDYLNVSNKEWRNPTSGKIETASLYDLFNKAREDCRIIDTILYNYKDNIVTKRKMDKFTNNINHDGRDLDGYMTYFKNIFEGEK